MRVEPTDVADVRSRVFRDGTAYEGDDLDGAELDIRSALWDEGFAETEIRRTGVREEMLVVPTVDLRGSSSDEVTSRIEEAWSVASFAQEVHTLDVEDDAVLLRFMTWWPHRVSEMRRRESPAFYVGSYLTGCIRVSLVPGL